MQLLDLGLGDPLVDVAGPRLQQQRVPAAQDLVHQRGREPDDALLVGVRDDQGPLAVGEQFLEHHDLAHRLIALRDDDVERLVEDDFLARPQLGEVDVGADVHPHLPAAGEHVGGVVIARRQEHAEPGWRLRQPVDLLLQRDDLVPGLTQRRRQPLILRGDRRQACLCLAEPFLQQANLARGISEPATQYRDLLIEEGDLRGKAAHLILVPRSPPALVLSCHGPHLLRGVELPRPYLSGDVP